MNYEDKIFITFDMDWANDDILNETLEILDKENIKVTFFITNYINNIEYLKKNNKFELGIHPNFNQLFDKKSDISADEILSRVKNIVPEATSLRSHCLTQSSFLMDKFIDYNITHETNALIPIYSNMHCYPYKDYSGIIKVPFMWEDDCNCLDIKNNYIDGWGIDDKLNRKGLKIFNFHPVHVFLNTENLNRYRSSKIYYNDVNKLKNYQFNSDEYGTKCFLKNLIKRAKEREMEFKLINEIII